MLAKVHCICDCISNSLQNQQIIIVDFSCSPCQLVISASCTKLCELVSCVLPSANTDSVLICCYNSIYSLFNVTMYMYLMIVKLYT